MRYNTNYKATKSTATIKIMQTFSLLPVGEGDLVEVFIWFSLSLDLLFRHISSHQWNSPSEQIKENFVYVISFPIIDGLNGNFENPFEIQIPVRLKQKSSKELSLAACNIGWKNFLCIMNGSLTEGAVVLLNRMK